MIKFSDFNKSSVLSESAAQKHKVMMRRPTPLFKQTETLELPNPPKLTSQATKVELLEVMDAMVLPQASLLYLKDLDVNFMEIMKDMVGRSPEDEKLVDELKRQIDTLTLRQKYHFNRLRPKEAAIFYHKTLVPHVEVDTPSYPSNHAVVGFVVADILGRKHPEKKNDLMRIAQQNADSRVSLGVHYPIDVEAGKTFADQLIDRYIETELVPENKKIKFKRGIE